MHGFRLFFLFHRLAFWDNHCTSRERETFWYLFRLCTPYGSRVSLTEEEEEEERRRRKKMTIFDFFKIRLLSFCTAELKSEDIFVLRRVRAFSGYSLCWLNPQTTCLFTLVYCTVKTFQPPSSLHRDCYRNLWYTLRNLGRLWLCACADNLPCALSILTASLNLSVKLCVGAFETMAFSGIKYYFLISV